MKIRVLLPLLAGLCVVLVAQASDLKTQLGDVLGAKESWKPKVFTGLKAGMPCEEVKKIYVDLAVCDATKDYDFQKVAVADQPLISHYEFVFNMGKLKEARILFKSNIDKDEFKKASLELFEAKWGVVKPEKREMDILTAIGPSYVKAQRVYMGSQWQLNVDMPTTE